MADADTGAVVLLSGGLDSTTLLHYAARELRRAPVFALSFDYGQRHARELACARWQAEAAGVGEHRVVDLRFLREVLREGSALVEGGAAVPDLRDLSADQLDQPPTYVPNRNMLLLSIAAAYAESKGVRDVFYGAQAQDEYGYWDCTADFLERMNAVLALNRRDAIRIHAPFVGWRKAETLRRGLALGVDYAQTWSCYRGGEVACGTCPTCVERRNAFREAGLTDPLPYER
jgi:7-cyano-7-deazaguanine synthase